MAEVCPNCGLPKELCVCETIAKESQAITLSVIKKKFGKKYTVVEGIDQKDVLKSIDIIRSDLEHKISMTEKETSE